MQLQIIATRIGQIKLPIQKFAQKMLILGRRSKVAQNKYSPNLFTPNKQIVW